MLDPDRLYAAADACLKVAARHVAEHGDGPVTFPADVEAPEYEGFTQDEVEEGAMLLIRFGWLVWEN